MKKLINLMLVIILGILIAFAVVVLGDVWKDRFGTELSIRSATEQLRALGEDVSVTLSTNYVPPEGTGELVGDAGDAGEGSTGTGFTFDETLYPYRLLLPEELRPVYNQIYANALSVNADSFAPVAEILVNDLEEIVCAVYNDHPELFWLENGYAYRYLSSGRVASVSLMYNETVADLDRCKAAFDGAAATVLAGAAAYERPVDREKYVHDYLMEHVTYDTASAMNQSAYSALVLGASVCAGYSRAFQYLLQQLEIPSYYCTGYAAEGNHAWNLVLLDGAYYNVDASWNDTLGTAYGSLQYTYFNMPDSLFLADHMRGDFSSRLPSCEGTAMTYAAVYGASKASGTSQYATYQELGYTDNDIAHSLKGYYRYCRKQLIRKGLGTYSFTVLLEDETLLNEIYASLEAQDYLEGYVRAAAEELELTRCSISIKLAAERLAGGIILLTQTVTLSGETATSTPALTVTPEPTPEPTAEPVITVTSPDEDGGDAPGEGHEFHGGPDPSGELSGGLGFD